MLGKHTEYEVEWGYTDLSIAPLCYLNFAISIIEIDFRIC